MPNSPIDNEAIRKSAKALVNRVIPPLDELAKASEIGYSYLGFGLLRARADWTVDRDATTTAGGSLDASADIAEIAQAVAAGGMPPAKLEAAIEAAIERRVSMDGAGPHEFFVLPIFIPTSQVEAVCAMARVVFEGLAGRVESAKEREPRRPPTAAAG